MPAFGFSVPRILSTQVYAMLEGCGPLLACMLQPSAQGFMKLAAKCFMEARQIFMNNSKSSVLKCKVCSEWGWRPRCFLSELGRSLSFQRLVGPCLFLRSPESPSFPEKARPVEHTPRSTQGLAHRKAS